VPSTFVTTQSQDIQLKFQLPHFVDEFLLKEDMIEILPAIEEANSISEEMDKKLRFEAAVVSAESRGELTGRPQVTISPLIVPSWYLP